jgi:hypothetical protein
VCKKSKNPGGNQGQGRKQLSKLTPILQHLPTAVDCLIDRHWTRKNSLIVDLWLASREGAQ